MIRKASAVWKGGLKDGTGTVSSESGVLSNTAYSFGTRFENGKGTNPEELIAAAHAGCFSMALSAQLGAANITPESIETSAELSLEKLDSGWTITKVHLDTVARIPGGDKAAFEKAAQAAKEGCPVSKLLKAAVTMSARLALLALFVSVSVSAEAAQTTASMESLLAAGQDVTCTFDQALENGAQTGTIYVSQNKMRGDFNVTNERGSNLMHIIRDGEWTYTWGGELGNQGIKLKATDAARDLGNPQTPEFGKDMQFDCSPWSANQDLLQVPADVQFMEMGSLLPPGMGAGQTAASQVPGMPAGMDMSQMCGACEQVAEAERDQCKQMLGC